MEELARIALLTESAQPVLAYCREAFAFARVRGQGLWRLEVEWGRLGVAERAVQGAEWAACRRERQPANLIVCCRKRVGGEMRCGCTRGREDGKTHLCRV